MRYIFFGLFVVGWLCVSGVAAAVQEAAVEIDGQSAAADVSDEAAIKAVIQSYVSAFNSQDVPRLVGLWSPEGIYTSRATGAETVGREEMAASLNELFQDKTTAPKLSVETDSIEFVSPNVAIERGTATVALATGEVDVTSYSVVYVRRDGDWLMDRVTEDTDDSAEPNHYEQLKVLEGLIGEWVAEGEGFRMEISNQWTANLNFIASRYKVVENDVESSGLQIIGWDEKGQKIRSWLFDSAGTVVTGTWHKRDDGWSIPSLATLGGGESGSYTGVLRVQEDGNYSWEKINQVVDDQLLPNIDEIVMKRQ